MSAASALAINRMLGLLQSFGRRLDTVERYAGSGRFIDWTPVLTATVTNPTFGAGALFGGRYTRIGNWVFAIGDCRLGGAGFAKGSGTYTITLPVQRTTITTANSDMIMGNWRCIQAGSVADIPQVITGGAGALTMTARYPSAYPVGANDLTVTDLQPFTFAANARISFTIMYEAEE